MTIETLQYTAAFEQDLKKLAKKYNGTEPDGSDRIGSYLSTEKYWYNQMITH